MLPCCPVGPGIKGPVPCACAVILGSDLAMCTLGRHGATVGWYSLLELCIGVAQFMFHCYRYYRLLLIHQADSAHACIVYHACAYIVVLAA